MRVVLTISCLLMVWSPGCFRLGLDRDRDRASDAGGDTSIPDGDPDPDADEASHDVGAKDAPGDGDHDADAQPDGPPFDAGPLEPFGTPTNVNELNLPNVNSEDPTLTDDLLEIVFSSTRPGGVGGVDLWTSQRLDVTAPWDSPVLVEGVNSTSADTTPEISGDGTVLIFASSRPGGAGLYDLYQATRTARGEPWGAPSRIEELASAEDEFAGTLSADRCTIVFSSSRSGGLGGGDIYMATRSDATAAWDPPSAVSSLNTTDDDSAPWMSASGLTIFFSSTRDGGEGAQDVWMATRSSASEPWNAATPVEELNSSDYDSDPWLSPDLRTIVYSRLEGSFRNVFTATR